MGHVWVFDVDGCLVDSLTGSSLRPGASALLAHLRSIGCRVLLWSAGGAEYARERAATHGVESLFDGFHMKAARDGAGRYIPAFVEAEAVVFVDDRPEDMPVDADVVAVSPYIAPNPHDRGLRDAAARAGLELAG